MCFKGENTVQDDTQTLSLWGKRNCRVIDVESEAVSFGLSGLEISGENLCFDAKLKEIYKRANLKLTL